MTIVKLTAKGAGVEVYVNPDHIVSFWKNETGSEVTTAAIREGNSVKLNVTESPSEVAVRISDAYRNRI